MRGSISLQAPAGSIPEALPACFKLADLLIGF